MIDRRLPENKHIRDIIDSINALREINPSLTDKARSVVIEALKTVSTKTDELLVSALASVEAGKNALNR